MQNQSAQSGPFRPITLRRDGKGALKFNGERIGAATRYSTFEPDNDQVDHTFQISARLFKTSGGKYVVGIEVYDQTEESYDCRDGYVGASLEELVQAIPRGVGSWTDDDLLGELFEDTEMADQFVEHID